MATVLAMNLTAVDAKAVFQPPHEPEPAELTYLLGDYRIVAVYPGEADGFIDENDIGAVIRIGYDTEESTSGLDGDGNLKDISRVCGMAIEASSNSRFSFGINSSLECSHYFNLELPSQYCEIPNAIAEACLYYIEPAVQEGEGEYAGHVVIGYSQQLHTGMVMNGNKIIFYHRDTKRPVFEIERIN